MYSYGRVSNLPLNDVWECVVMCILYHSAIMYTLGTNMGKFQENFVFFLKFSHDFFPVHTCTTADGFRKSINGRVTLVIVCVRSLS